MKRPCDTCGTSYEAKTKRSRFCSDRCRVQGHRSGTSKVVELSERRKDSASSGGVAAATLAELEQAGRVDSVLGRSALALASRIDLGERDTGSAFASLVKELRSTMEAALATAQRESPVDELRRRRLERMNA